MSTYPVVGLLWLVALSASAQQVRVMQWNVNRNLGNAASINSSQARAIARIVNYNQPDIITFNELLDNGTIATAAGLIAWVTNNLTYLGNQTGVTFWVNIATVGDGSIRNGAISRYPISGAFTYSDGLPGCGTCTYNNLRGMQSFQVQLSSTNKLQVFHVHLKCCGDGSSCPRKQEEAQVNATNIVRWASTNSFPYIFAGDLNESEDPRDTPVCAITGTYHPITTLLQGGQLVDYAPTTLGGQWTTWTTGNPGQFNHIRFDYILAATNRLSPMSGFVFSTTNWAANGLYTNAVGQFPGTYLANDSQTASDHYPVQVTYSFPTSATNFNVTPATAFTSTGNPGGPFSPVSQVYTLTNSDVIPMFWSVTKTSNWLTVSLLATNRTLGAGRSTNITASINSAANSLAAGTYVDTINFSNTATGVSIARGVTLTVGSSPPSASFSGNPTNGVTPLAVVFSDTSTGSITNRFWDFGDTTTTNVTTNGVSRIYTAGTYTVRLIVSGTGGASTNTKLNYINVLTAFQAWQIQYFGGTNNPAAASEADPDGDGCNNLCEFLTGTNPTNSASSFRIISIATLDTNVLISWATAGGRTNVVQAVTNSPDSSFSNNFVDVSPPIIISVGDFATNYLDVGAATNVPARYYRIRLQP